MSKALLILFFLIAFYCPAVSSQRTDLASLTGNYSDSVADINGDGKLDYLTINVGVHVELPGEYSLTGYLYDRNNKEIDWSVDHGNLTYSNHTMRLSFDGKTIQKSGSKGPFRLGDLYLTFGSSNMGLIIVDRRDNAYKTASYKASDFVDPSSTDKMIQGSGKGEILLTFSIRTAVPVYQGRYMLDIVGLNMPPISTPVQVKGSNTGYNLSMEGIFIPKKPNNFTITASRVKNLNVGLMKLQGKLQRTWVSSQFKADKSAKAKAETDLISPNGSYHVKIFGDAADNMTSVDLMMIAVKKLIVNGPFNLTINTTGFPAGSYSIAAKALNGSFSFDDLAVNGLSMEDPK